MINVDITKIKPYNKNAKKHPKDQVAKIAASIKEFGFRQPLVVDKDYNIIVGHGRYEAAKLIGLKELPCIVADNLSPEQIKAYRLADNKLNESDWDMELVLEDYQELDLGMQNLSGFILIDFEKDLSSANKEIEIEDLKTTHECPKCGFSF